MSRDEAVGSAGKTYKQGQWTHSVYASHRETQERVFDLIIIDGDDDDERDASDRRCDSNIMTAFFVNIGKEAESDDTDQSCRVNWDRLDNE